MWIWMRVGRGDERRSLNLTRGGEPEPTFTCGGWWVLNIAIGRRDLSKEGCKEELNTKEESS